jgi:4-hydroxymandelate synthase
MRIKGIDHVEWYVGNLEKSAETLCHDYGFEVASQGVPDPDADGQTVVLRHGPVTLLITAARSPGHPAAEFVRRHGDGVAIIAFSTDDVQKAFDVAVNAGALPIAKPAYAELDGSRIGTAIVSGFGDVTHRLIQRTAPAPQDNLGDGLLTELDHVAVCLPAGELENTVAFYRDAFGLAQIFDERIEVSGQAMLSKVMQDHGGHVTFTLIEPDPTLDPGQIDDFLAAHGGAGVQHLAFRTMDIAQAVRTMTSRGIDFLPAPAGYYRALEGRLGTLVIPVDALEKLNVLADRDTWGQMFQIFTRSAHERHTFFFELSERQGALTFGSNNIRALYEALGEEQASIALPD